MPQQRMLRGSIASSSDMLRANCSVSGKSLTSSGPVSVPQKTTSLPSGNGPASWSSAASGVPVQMALPISPKFHPKPWLPEHSIVKATS